MNLFFTKNPIKKKNFFWGVCVGGGGGGVELRDEGLGK